MMRCADRRVCSARAGAVARPRRAGAGAGGLGRRQHRDLRQLRHVRDPLVARRATPPSRCCASTTSAVNAVAILPDGRIVTGGEDGRIAIWQPGAAAPDSRARRPHRADRRRSRSRPTARRSPRRRGTAPCGCGRSRAARRACSKAISRTSTASPSRPTAARWSAPATTRRADLAARRSGAPIVTTLPTPLNAVAVAPDGEIVAGGADGKVYFLSPAASCAARSQAGADADHRARGVGRRRAGRGRRHPRLGRRSSSAPTRKLARTLVGPGLPVWSVAFLPDNRTLLTGGTDRMVRRWDATTGEHIGAVAMGGAGRSARGLCRRSRRRSLSRLRRLPHADARRRQPRRARRCRHFRPPDRDAAGLQFLRRR